MVTLDRGVHGFYGNGNSIHDTYLTVTLPVRNLTHGAVGPENPRLGTRPNFARFQKLVAGKRRFLGRYLWDFGTNRPMPLALMKRQSQLGLKWLREGRVDGLIFRGTNLCDFDLETVEWTRKWITTVSAQPLRQQR